MQALSEMGSHGGFRNTLRQGWMPGDQEEVVLGTQPRVEAMRTQADELSILQ